MTVEKHISNTIKTLQNTQTSLRNPVNVVKTALEAHEGGGAVRKNLDAAEKGRKNLAEKLTRCKWRFGCEDGRGPLD